MRWDSGRHRQIKLVTIKSTVTLRLHIICCHGFAYIYLLHNSDFCHCDVVELMKLTWDWRITILFSSSIFLSFSCEFEILSNVRMIKIAVCMSGALPPPSRPFWSGRHVTYHESQDVWPSRNATVTELCPPATTTYYFVWTWHVICEWPPHCIPFIRAFNNSFISHSFKPPKHTYNCWYARLSSFYSGYTHHSFQVNGECSAILHSSLNSIQTFKRCKVDRIY